MAKKKASQVIQRVIEDEEMKRTWTYDPSITTFGPISVDIVYKKEPVNLVKQRKKRKVNK
jgi:hypothetical protein